MKKTIREVDKERGIFQLTTVDERFYIRSQTDTKTGLPFYQYVPSVTWITHYYHKGEELLRYYGNRGYDEAKQLMHEAGDRGSRTHLAIADLLQGNGVKADAKYPNESTGQMEELTSEEWVCIDAFGRWFEKVQPTVIASEIVVWNDEHNYAGTVDFICKIGEDVWIIDFKTGQNIYAPYELQVSAYKHAIPEYADKDVKLGILRLGYKRNKDRYKLDEVQDDFPTFLSVRDIWKKEAGNQQPAKIELPLEIKLNITTASESQEGEATPETNDEDAKKG